MCDTTQGSLWPSPMKIHQSMWIQWLFSKSWTKGHWPLDDLWPQVCWGHMCDSTQGSFCPSPMGIHQCMWIQWSILQNTTYYLQTVHTTYIMSDHIVSFWTSSGQTKRSIKIYEVKSETNDKYNRNLEKFTLKKNYQQCFVRFLLLQHLTWSEKKNSQFHEMRYARILISSLKHFLHFIYHSASESCSTFIFAV